MKIANQKELNEAVYNDYQIVSERLQRKRNELIAKGLIEDTIQVVRQNYRPENSIGFTTTLNTTILADRDSNTITYSCTWT